MGPHGIPQHPAASHDIPLMDIVGCCGKLRDPAWEAVGSRGISRGFPLHPAVSHGTSHEPAHKSTINNTNQCTTHNGSYYTAVYLYGTSIQQYQCIIKIDTSDVLLNVQK